MCGIVGYIGKNNASEYLLDGLETLEYRGYDSAGIAILKNNQITTTRSVGRVERLRELVENSHSNSVSEIGIGHTRWATHGGVVNKNTHPHWDQSKQFYVVHNGIIENYQEIKLFLEKQGYVFYSDTDTEVIPNLVAYHYQKTKNVQTAFKQSLQLLRGAYAIVMVSTHNPDKLFAAKLSSPLAIGVGKNEMFIGSDSLPLASRTNQIVFVEDGEVAVVSSNDYQLTSLTDDRTISRAAELLDIEETSSSLGDFPDYMSKEMHEAPATVRSAILGRLRADENIIKLGGLDIVQNQLQHIERIVVIACGTSYYAGLIGEYLIEEIANIPVEVQQASEFRYRTEPLSRSTAVLVVSQSGETADTIAALKKLEGTGILKLGIVNAPGSTLSRMTDAGVYCHAGPEKAVASTKAFIAQVTVFILIALHLSKNYAGYTDLLNELNELPQKLDQLLTQEKSIQKIAKKYAHHQDFQYIGRRYAYPVALEGALKLKEISYIHAEGFAGGEMKHGPLALVDVSFPTFAIALTNDLHEKTFSNMQEVHARKGPIVALVDDKQSPAAKLANDSIVIPHTLEPLQPILAAVATHLFAYYAAKELGRDIDKPRNLAKSVTVE